MKKVNSIGIPFDINKAKKASVIGGLKSGGVDYYIGDIEIGDDVKSVKDVMSLAKSKYPDYDVWYLEVEDETGEPMWEVGEEPNEITVVSYKGLEFSKGGSLRGIMKSIKDHASPFSVIAVDTNKGKVLKQEISIQDYRLIPAHYREMAKEFPNSEIRIEDSTGISMYRSGGEVNGNHRFTYMMLGRLQNDNEYFLGNGNASERTLWAGSVEGQIAEMRKRFNELPEDAKPEWLSMKSIDAYERQMLEARDETKYAKGGSVKSKGYFEGCLSFLNW